ncbi:hypothetical protein BDW59DRAFT_148450, partial [Aspergillus cavernicola]
SNHSINQSINQSIYFVSVLYISSFPCYALIFLPPRYLIARLQWSSLNLIRGYIYV